MITLDDLVGFEEIGDIAVGNSPQLCLDPFALHSDHLFGLAA
jgi:hypothetical protein